ncbi:hypothetical protein MKW92_002784 [Papaver armeniacum]|nr:hypothetical protein MKW92_002784 [Papaver armeniacum]
MNEGALKDYKLQDLRLPKQCGTNNLNIEGIDLYGHADKWCRTLSSSLPKLQVLSMPNCGLSGPFDSSLLKLQSLSVLQLDFNDINSVPTHCRLHGKFPEGVLQLQTLQSLDLGGNDRLQGFLPEFPKGGLLGELVVSFTSPIPAEWNNLQKLVHLDLTNNLLNGTIPTALLTLHSLKEELFSMNQFTGQLGEFAHGSSSPLETLDLSSNQLQGCDRIRY